VYVIGLTGNIGTGKSTVAHLLAARGAMVIDADVVAHAEMAPGTAAWQEIQRAFPGVTGPDGRVDRRKLGAIVFADPARLAQLEAIVHPAVRQTLVRRLQQMRASPQPPRVVVIEAIKLLESGLPALCDAIWVVDAPRDVQIERLMRTRGLSREEAVLRIDAQPPAELKRQRADVIVENAGSLPELAAQVQPAWERIPGAA
jgi:dephospho-CoA kinase